MFRSPMALFVLPIAVCSFAGTALADPISLIEISRYFNSFFTAQSGFTQINPNGTLFTGRLFIRRPGRVRFEYDPPEQSLVLAGGGQVAIFDGRSNQGPTQYPLSRTPLSLILAEDVDFSTDSMVVDHFNDDTTTSVVAQDPEHPEYGNIRLVFTHEPTELRQWIITDDIGRETTVILGEMEVDGKRTPRPLTQTAASLAAVLMR
jgi:outer membrane lipoprotein-sorting protein